MFRKTCYNLDVGGEKRGDVRGTRVNVSGSRANREERCTWIITAVIRRVRQATSHSTDCGGENLTGESLERCRDES